MCQGSGVLHQVLIIYQFSNLMIFNSPKGVSGCCECLLYQGAGVMG